MTPARLLMTGVVTAAGLAVLAYGSAVPVAYHRTDAARLRLSWSAKPERIEVCRPVSDAAQAELGEHMRQRVDCEGRSATYALRVEVDGIPVGESVVRGSGLRHDRPLYLLSIYSVPPGEHRILVSLIRREKTDNDSAAWAPVPVPGADTGLFAGRAEREVTERRRRARAAIPASLLLDTVAVFSPRRVALVIFDPDRRALRLQGEAPRR